MYRPAILALLASAAFAAAGLAHAQAPAAASHPAWVDSPVESDGRASITRIIAGAPDVVVLDRGLSAGLRMGAPCLVERNGAPVAEIIIVASQSGRAAALITGQAAGVTLQGGDQVRLKTISRII
jgi:hypothetical protein